MWVSLKRERSLPAAEHTSTTQQKQSGLTYIESTRSTLTRLFCYRKYPLPTQATECIQGCFRPDGRHYIEKRGNRRPANQVNWIWQGVIERRLQIQVWSATRCQRKAVSSQLKLRHFTSFTPRRKRGPNSTSRTKVVPLWPVGGSLTDLPQSQTQAPPRWIKYTWDECVCVLRGCSSLTLLIIICPC